MNYKTKSYFTKIKLANSLKKLMQEKNFKKISIVDITSTAKVNRKTFYYHFTSIPELLKWMLEHETVEIAQKFDLLNNFEDAFQFSINYINKNKNILASAYNNLGREVMRNFFINDFINIIKISIDKCEQENNLSVDENFKLYLSEFYSEGIACRIIEYLKGDTKFSNTQVLDYFQTLFSDSLPVILKNASQKNLC